MKLKVITSLSLFLLNTALGCSLLNPPNESPTPPPPIEEPADETTSNKISGEFCTFERIFPKEIHINERFIVKAVIEIKQQVQSAYLEEDGWFREFRVIQEPVSLWLDLGPGETRTFIYEVEMWLNPPDTHQVMFGSVSCNVGGLGESEVLELESNLKEALQ